jgi:GH24 family phage-related lysozyme (muramidase)
MTGHALKISSAAIALIKKHQGLSLEKYRDENGLWVIGWPCHPRGNFRGLSHLPG